MKKILLLAGISLLTLNVVNAEECACGCEMHEQTVEVAQAPDVTVAANDVKEEVPAEDTEKVSQDLEKAFAELQKDSQSEETTKAA